MMSNNILTRGYLIRCNKEVICRCQRNVLVPRNGNVVPTTVSAVHGYIVNALDNIVGICGNADLVHAILRLDESGLEDRPGLGQRVDNVLGTNSVCQSLAFLEGILLSIVGNRLERMHGTLLVHRNCPQRCEIEINSLKEICIGIDKAVLDHVEIIRNICRGRHGNNASLAMLRYNSVCLSVLEEVKVVTVSYL